MLVGRDEERGRLNRLIDQARAGRGASLIIHGEPGIGKTALLDFAAGAASDFTRLRVRPLEAEAELPFAGLGDLVRPILGMLEQIPTPQQEALASALALGPPSPSDRFAVATATLSLMAASAEEGPVLALVDDAHWLDAPSREALIFAGRRLLSEGVLLLFGARDHAWVHTTGIDTLRLDGLPPQDAAALVTQVGASVEEAVCELLVAETGGNPLALIEVLNSLNDDQCRGLAPISHPVAIGEQLRDWFGEHLAGLAPDTQRALLVAAASETGSAWEIEQALDGAGLALSALDPAEKQEIVTFQQGRIVFRHPLVRSAAYHLFAPADQRTAHRDLASVILAESGERAAWHLVAASTGADEGVAALLERSATDSFKRSAYVAAARGFEAAATLSPMDEDRLRRIMSAGRALFLGGKLQRASTLLENAIEVAVDPTLLADLQELRAATMLFTRPVFETYALLIAAAERIESHDPDRAVALLTNAAMAQFMAADQKQAGQTVGRALQIAGADPIATLQTRIVEAMVRAIDGEVEQALALSAPLVEHYLVVDPHDESPFMIGCVAQTLRWVEEWDQAYAILHGFIGAARAAGAPSLLPFPLAVLANSEFERGKIASAYAAATESVQLAAETGQAVESSYSLVVLARVDAVLGHTNDCRKHVAAGLTFSRQLGVRSIELFAAGALGLLDLSLGYPDRALVHLAQCQRLTDSFEVQLPTLHETEADYVEACVRSGAVGEARRSLATLEERAAATGLRWPTAMAARCRGLLAEEGAYEPEFAVALDLLGEGMHFEYARTLLCLGIRRRRSRRRAAARHALHDALAFFDSAGAEPWAEQARAELRAAGDASIPAPDRSIWDLTPQELQVALVVSKGASNKEAAASLFLSPKTVEFHLGNAYQKLGLHSRTQLVRVIEGI